MSGMTAATTLLAFSRFVARRGVPTTVYSDNAQTFRHCARSFKAFVPVLQEYAATTLIQWKFIAERTSWWGGWWECLIWSTKDALKWILGCTSLDAEGLMTTLCEVEAIINSRPLTYLEDDPNEMQALTLAHFLLGKEAIAMPESGPTVETSTHAELQRRTQYRKGLSMELWRRWKRAYLLQLRSVHYHLDQVSSQIRVGDVVIVHEEDTSPTFWKLGRVTSQHPGRDGLVRVCSVHLATGHG